MSKVEKEDRKTLKAFADKIEDNWSKQIKSFQKRKRTKQATTKRKGIITTNLNNDVSPFDPDFPYSINM